MNSSVRTRAAVVGNPIAHSLSPQLHTAGWNAVNFTKIELPAAGLASFLQECDDSWAGIAVTMPLKYEAVKAADIVDGLAKAVGSANTIVFQPTGANSRLCVAFNTDVAGIVNAIRESTETVRFQRGVILGSGATASSALAAMVELGVADITVCARRAGGPNTVFAAAHRLHLDLQYLPLESIQCAQRIAESDLVISTLPAHIADPIARQLKNLASLILLKMPLAQRRLLAKCYWTSFMIHRRRS
ncbi:shikimate dehydrogenase family protein [Arcanobacterium hippocoleae]|uniref:shikimate dehydrogenase family protein n=1 Tax=Arcanobacterium hippocoleae TaxID=149017 RepID=UPI0033420014